MSVFKIFHRAVAVLPTLVLCTVGAPAHAVVLRHLLWDASQRPSYQQCARDFEKTQPDIRIRVQQQGWGEYWTTLATGFISNTAPDVFVNHLTRFPEFVENEVLLDLAPFIARDRLNTGAYVEGLYDNWSQGTHQYAIPADWDTVALIVNLDMAARAGITLEQLQSMSWNPVNGGSFGRIAALLTQDDAGRNALDPAFDKTRVKVRGYQTPAQGGSMGQTAWSHFAASNGFRFQDQRWSNQLRYDDPRLAQTLQWLAGLTERGISATPQVMGSLGIETLFITGGVAMIPLGSWMTSHMNRNVRFARAWVPMPRGPQGTRHTMLNGVAHSIWVGSKHREQAWQWLRYLGSPECQQMVAQAGVVYPAIRGLAQTALQVQRAAGADAQAFLEMARASTLSPPVAPHAAEVDALIGNAVDSIVFSGLPPLPTLQRTQAQVRRIMQP